MALLVPFGLKDGGLYEPTQVLNGKDCGCVCPGCIIHIQLPSSFFQNVPRLTNHHSQRRTHTVAEKGFFQLPKQLPSSRISSPFLKQNAVVFASSFEGLNQCFMIHTSLQMNQWNNHISSVFLRAQL